MTDHRRNLEEVLKRNMAAIGAAQETLRQWAIDRAERVVARARESMPADDDDEPTVQHRVTERHKRLLLNLAYLAVIIALLWLIFHFA